MPNQKNNKRKANPQKKFKELANNFMFKRHEQENIKNPIDEAILSSDQSQISDITEPSMEPIDRNRIVKKRIKDLFNDVVKNNELTKQHGKVRTSVNQSKGKGSLTAFHIPVTHPNQGGYYNSRVRETIDQSTLRAFNPPITTYANQGGYNTSRVRETLDQSTLRAFDPPITTYANQGGYNTSRRGETLDQRTLSAFDPPITTYSNQGGYNNSRVRETLDQRTLRAFDPPITTYANQGGYNNSRTREIALLAIPITHVPTLEEQRAANNKRNRLNRKKRKGEVITKEDELTDQEKIAKNTYNRNQKRGKFVIPISGAPEPTLEEQKAAKSKESSLYRKKRKGEVITKEDELTDQEKIAKNAYNRNEKKGKFTIPISIAPEPPMQEQRAANRKYNSLSRKRQRGEVITKEDELTDEERIAYNAYQRRSRRGELRKPISSAPEPKLPTRNMFLSHEKGRISERFSKRRKVITKF